MPRTPRARVLLVPQAPGPRMRRYRLARYTDQDLMDLGLLAAPRHAGESSPVSFRHADKGPPPRAAQDGSFSAGTTQGGL